MEKRRRKPDLPENDLVDESYKKLDELDVLLRIDKNVLDDALLEQPDIFYRVSTASALATSRRDAAKRELEEVTAKLTTEAWADARRADDKKITKGEIESEVLLDPDVKDAQKDLTEWTLLAARWSALVESFKQRSKVLPELVALYLAGYFGERTGSKERRGADERTYAKNREILKTAREKDDNEDKD